MALPTQRTVDGLYTHPVTGNPQTGSVVFAPYPAFWADTNGNQIMAGEFEVTLVNGAYSQPLIVTENADVLPSTGKLWRYTERIDGESIRVQFFELPVGVGNVNIKDLIMIDPSTPPFTPSGAAGGDLVGNYPSPQLANTTAARAHLGLGNSATKDVGTTAGTVAAGDDPRFGSSSGSLQAANNLSDVQNAATSRTNLGLGDSATKSVGTGSGTVAAGDDSRITGAAQKSQNLADLVDKALSRTNLGLGGSAVLNVGTGATTVAAGDDSRITGAAQKSQNLADLADPIQARSNLGLGNSATRAVGAVAGTVAAGDDARFTDSRTPTAHALSHAAGQSDPLTLTQAQITGLVTSLAALLPLAGGTMTGAINGTLNAAGTTAQASLVSGDTFDRFRRYADGKTEWGPGNAARDTNLYRDAADSLRTDDSLTIAGNTRTLGWLTYRRRDLPDMLTADSLYSGAAPTIGTAQTTTPTAGYVKYAPAGVALAGSDVTGPFTYSGCGNLAIGAAPPDTSYVLPLSKHPNTYASGQSTWSVEFGTDSQIIQVRFKHINAATMFRMSIDGRKVTDLMQSAGGITPGSGHLITIDFGSAANRRIRFDFSTFPFGGVYIPPTATLWGVSLDGGRLMSFTDSIGDGSSQNTGAGCGTWVDRVGRMMGSTDVWRQGRGGTGYITDGSYTRFGNRSAADVVAWNPNRLVIWGGYNDSSGLQSDILTAANSLFASIKAGLPFCEVLVLGCWSPSGSPGSTLTNTDATLRTAAATAGYPFVSPITGSIYNSTGSLVNTHGAFITAANAAAYIGGDAVHPNDAGHIYLSRRIYTAWKETMPA